MKPDPLWKDAVSLAEFLQPPVKRNVYSITRWHNNDNRSANHRRYRKIFSVDV